jgi:hypothetical protein
MVTIMSDNTTMNPGSGGDVIATDELATINGAAAPAGLKIQRVKMGFGGDGDAQDVSADHPLPVVVASGATAAAQAAGNDILSSIEAKMPDLIGGKLPVIDPSALPLPAGAATAVGQAAAAVAQLAQDDRIDLMLYFLSAILEKMPTPDNADRMRINLESSTQTQMGISGISNPSTGALTPINSMPFDLPNIGSSRLYDQVVFS